MNPSPISHQDTTTLHSSYTQQQLWEEFVDFYDGKNTDAIVAFSLKNELIKRGAQYSDFVELVSRLGIRNCFMNALFDGSEQELQEHSLRAFRRGATSQFLLDTIYEYRKEAYEGVKSVLEASEKSID